jgi:hypothetical protein
MPVLRFFSATAQPTTLSGSISSGATSITVGATIGFPPSFPYTLALDFGGTAEELVDVTSAAGTTLTVTRAVDGTSAQSHSLGAVVRHVASARDHADYQTHQAATAAVHGVAGTLVGTSDIQTLANKTLTSPTVNSGALSGTFTGSPTFSGAPSLSGGGALAGTFTGSPTLSGNPTFTGSPSYNTTAGVLSQRSAASSSAWRTSVLGDTNDRWIANADGKLVWGSGSATGDVTLYRNAADELKTDDALTVVGNVTAANLQVGAWSSWTPIWSTSTGLHTPSFGNAVVTGTYVRIGRMLFFSLAVTFGSTTNFGTSVTTADNWIFSLPASLTASAAFAGTQQICGMGRASQSSGATIPFAVRSDGGGTNFTLDTSGGRQDAVALTNTGAVDSLTPWTWAVNNAFACQGAVETTT